MLSLTWSSSCMNSHGISLRNIFPKIVSSAGLAARALVTSSDIVFAPCLLTVCRLTFLFIRAASEVGILFSDLCRE